MGPIIEVPDDLAERLEQETHLVEAIVMADAVDQPDLKLGPTPGVFLLLKETPHEGFGGLVGMIATSDYAKSAPEPFQLTVRGKDCNPNAFPAIDVNEQSIQNHLKLAYFGEPGDRRPLIRA